MGMLMAVVNTYGAQEHFYNSINGKHFAKDSSLTVQDDKYGTPLWSTIQKNIKVTDIITLQLNEDTSLYLPAKHSYRVDLEITYYDSAGHADSLATTLIINYDTTKSKRFNFRSSFKFNGGYKVKARILTIAYDGTITTHFPAVFTLAGDIYIARVYDFICGSKAKPTHTFVPASQQLNISWPPFAGADEYDLEFTTYDDSSSVSKDSASTTYSDMGTLFKNNATRVTVQGIQYAINLVYNPGYVLYRLRPIHYDMNGNRIEGTWSSDTSLKLKFFVNRFHWKGHENAMNWQYTAAYAEQGKRKEVTSYFDGSLRNRQSVTINNTENKAIIGETIYDYQGRPAVTTLPGPKDSNKFTFYDKYNVDPSGSEYNRADFDTGLCEYTPIGMDSIVGSSRYYSSSNPDTTSGFDRFLPDAQGYPFTMTEYTPDNTGRISRQSIAGKTHRFGSGHETKYYYGKPAQIELDRLFGNEVGDCSHYLENMVIDANGQISVSYIDENGKTIATALAGQLPSNVKAIGSYIATPTTLTVNLLDSAGNIHQNTSIYSGYTFLATNVGRYYFTYKLFPGNYTDPTCSAAPCTDCLYDIQLMVTGDCDAPFILHYDSNLTYKQAFDTTCGHDNILDTFSVFINTPGNYNVSRLITVDPKAISYYTNRDAQKNTCIKPYSTFLSNAIANTNFSGCNMTCASCLTALGADSTFRRKYMTELHNAGELTHTHADTVNADTAYNQALAQCNALCGTFSPCTGLYDEILADVSLGGQYCTYTLVGGNYAAGDTYSALHNYTTPPNPPYKNSAGIADSVVINGLKYPPQQLTLNQFVLNWKPSWAGALVGLHPEYCFYTRCIADSASNRYDYDIENTSTYSAACTGGYLAPLGHFQHRNVCDTVNPDPYFHTGHGVSKAAFMKHRIDRYMSFVTGSGTVTLSMWGVASLMEYCGADTIAGLSMANCYNGTDTAMGSGCGVGDNNMAWSNLKGLYLSLKDSVKNLLDIANADSCNPAAGCVGFPTCTNYQTKTPRHITEQYAQSQANLGPNTPSKPNDIHFADSVIVATCDTTCLNYAFSWYNQLSTCGSVLHTDSARLINRLRFLCESGCNTGHPVGSLTTQYMIPDDSGDRDVEDILVSVLGVSRSNTQCDSLLINMPPPYNDSNALAGAQVSYTRPTTCMCNKLDTLLTRYYKPDSLSGDHTYVNFADYLNKNLGGSLADSTVYQILALCKSSCTYLPYAFQTPMWMNCCRDTSFGHLFSNPSIPWDTAVQISQGCCILCSDIQAGMRIYTQLSPAGADTLPNYQALLTNFLNDLYGFNLSYAQYNTFYTKCKAIHCTETVSYFDIPGWPPYRGMRTDSTCGGTTILDTFYNAPLPNNWTVIHHHTGTLGWTVTNSHYNIIRGSDTIVAYVYDSTRGGVTIIDTFYNNNSHNINRLTKRSYSNGPCTWTIVYTHIPGSNIPEMVVDSNCGGVLTIDTFSYAVTGVSYWVLQNRTIIGDINSIYGGSYSGTSATSSLIISPFTYTAHYNDTLWDGVVRVIDTLIYNFRWYRYSYYAHGLTPVSDTGHITRWNIPVGAHTYLGRRSDTSFSSNEITAIDSSYNYTITPTWVLLHRKSTPLSSPCVVTITYWHITVGSLHYKGERIDSNCDGENIIDTLYNNNADSTYTLATRNWNDGYGAYTWTNRLWTKPGPVGLTYDYLVVDSVLPNGNTVIDTLYNYNPADTVWWMHNRKVTGAKHDSLEPTLCNEPLNQYPQAATINYDTNTCYTYLMMNAAENAQNSYGDYIDSTENAFRSSYITHCMNVNDSFHMVMPFDEYHYTLYYYDQAQNLVKTIPPQGVHPITNATLLTDITKYRAGTFGTPTYPTDSLITRYFYNTLNSPIKQQTPDGDSVHYWYDRLGRVVLSQNAIQRPAWYLYGYTKYDALNRITEVGQISTVPQNLPGCFVCNHCIITYEVKPVVPDTFTLNQLELENFINLGTRTQLVHTYYDSAMFKYIPMTQSNLRKRIASITYKDNNNNPNGARNNPDSIYSRPDSAAKDYDNAIHYSYDIEGNVASILIDVPHDTIVHQRYKRINYYYDLVSGNVNEMIYEQDSIDQFIHVYQYDADNRITDVFTSRDSLYWENDASYQYYDHGPLAREVIGQRQVQGIDYAYTINGWVKGVNSSILSPSYDMGADGNIHDGNATIGRDAYGYVLNYFTGDYRSIAHTSFAAPGLPVTGLYNGNISGATYSMQTLIPSVLGYIYYYDQLNRYVGDSLFKNPGTNTWATRTGINDLKEKPSYDENGNILTYLRHGNTAVGHLGMDSMTYHYNKNTNQLATVTDVIPSTYYTVDIHNETSKHNYRYNKIGELASDSIAGIDSIYWTVYNKVKKIVKTNNDSIVFMYDPIGNRLEQRTFPHSGIADTVKYTRDATGNIMAIYDRRKDTVRLSEFDIYGSKRLGSLDTVLRMQKLVTGHGTIDSLTLSYLERQKQYELYNHLGNVLVTVSDGKTPVDTNAATHDTVASYYLPIVVNAQDYYPFGMIQPGRSYTLSGDSTYKYLFNGKYHDDNIYGKDNSYNYGARFYDPRLGRFMSTDPLYKKFPELSTYQFASNTPIQASDLDGKEADIDVQQYNQQSQAASGSTYDVNASDVERASAEAGILGLGLMIGGAVVVATTSETGVGAEFGAGMFRTGAAIGLASGVTGAISQGVQGHGGQAIATLGLTVGGYYGEGAALNYLQLTEKDLGGEMISLLSEANSTIIEKAVDAKADTKTATAQGATTQVTNNPSGNQGTSDPKTNTTAPDHGSLGPLKTPNTTDKATTEAQSNANTTQGTASNSSTGSSSPTPVGLAPEIPGVGGDTGSSGGGADVGDF